MCRPRRWGTSSTFRGQAGPTVDRAGRIHRTHTGLLPANVGSPEFLARLREDVSRVAQHEHMVARQLAADSDYVALCHWNANVDNAWFWRDADGVLRCGLLDWGCVSKMNMGMAIWGAMSGAETDMWNQHLDELLHLFVAQAHHYGGPKDSRRVARVLQCHLEVSHRDAITQERSAADNAHRSVRLQKSGSLMPWPFALAHIAAHHADSTAWSSAPTRRRPRRSVSGWAKRQLRTCPSAVSQCGQGPSKTRATPKVSTSGPWGDAFPTRLGTVGRPGAVMVMRRLARLS
jgi:hypothetical protein